MAFKKPDTNNSTFDYIIKKYNIEVGRQHQIDVEGMKGSSDLARLFAELGFKLGVEVGVDRGLYSEFLMQTIPGLKLFGVDPWTREVFEEGNPYKAPVEYFTQCYEETLKRMVPFGDNYKIIKKYSMDAVKDFEDNSLDFVYIDANHDFINFAMDLQFWLRKVRPGGIMSGHDYAYYSYSKFNHVKRCLIAYAREYRMIPIFAVMQGGELKRDKYRSWFYVKPLEEQLGNPGKYKKS